MPLDGSGYNLLVVSTATSSGLCNTYTNTCSTFRIIKIGKIWMEIFAAVLFLPQIVSGVDVFTAGIETNCMDLFTVAIMCCQWFKL